MTKRGRPIGSGRKEPTERECAMAKAYKAGRTLQEIGTEYGVTRERVRQILARRFGMDASSGGQSILAHHTAIRRAVARDERSLKRWGCTWAQYCMLREMKKPTRAHSQQKKNAEIRGIAWELTLWQWWTIWQESGRWERRGRGQGYVMCRKGDVGPYAIGNVFIERAAINSSEQARKKSGLPLGVRRDDRCRSRYWATRQINGKKIYLGRFATPEAAHAAYLAADQQAAA